MTVSDPILASMIAASATVLAALVQLRISWRREIKERERGQPISQKSRRGPVTFLVLLVVAAAIGGFTLSQYFLSLRFDDRDALRAELESRLAEISASAARLEQARLSEQEQSGLNTQKTEALHLGEEGVVASVMVGPCKPDGGPALACTEQNPSRVAVCATVPEKATVKEVLLYTRTEDVSQPWQESLVRPGQDAGQAKFAEKYLERLDGESGKLVCQGFMYWQQEASRVARIRVKYTP